MDCFMCKKQHVCCRTSGAGGSGAGCPRQSPFYIYIYIYIYTVYICRYIQIYRYIDM